MFSLLLFFYNLYNPLFFKIHMNKILIKIIQIDKHSLYKNKLYKSVAKDVRILSNVLQTIKFTLNAQST